MNDWSGSVLGIVIGCSGFCAWQMHRGPDPELVAARQQIAALTHDRAEAIAEAGETKGQLVALRIANQELIRRLEQTTPSAPDAVSSLPTPPVPQARIDLGPGRVFRERQLKDEAERLKRRLLLSAAQAQRIDHVLAEGLKGRENEPIFRLAQAPWFRDELDKILTPEQKAKHEALQAKDKEANAELGARFEVSQIEQAVEITEAQRQAIIQKLHEQRKAAGDLEIPSPSEDGAESDPLARMQTHMEERVRALDGILTPLQLEEYRKQLSAQMETMAAMFKARDPSSVPPQ